MKILILLFSLNAFASAGLEADCHNGDKKSCEKFLSKLVMKQDFKKFISAYEKVCANPALGLTCEEVKNNGDRDQMRKISQTDPHGAFYNFPDSNPKAFYHVTPLTN